MVANPLEVGEFEGGDHLNEQSLRLLFVENAMALHVRVKVSSLTVACDHVNIALKNVSNLVINGPKSIRFEGKNYDEQRRDKERNCGGIRNCVNLVP